MYSPWWAWYGGLSWGARFFVFAAVPASILIAVRIERAGRSALADGATLAVLPLSAWVATSGAIVDLGAPSFCGSDGYAHEQLCWFTPDYSSLWEPLRQFPALTASTLIVALYCGLVFAHLALPLAKTLPRALRPRPARAASGWRL